MHCCSLDVFMNQCCFSCQSQKSKSHFGKEIGIRMSGENQILFGEIKIRKPSRKKAGIKPVIHTIPSAEQEHVTDTDAEMRPARAGCSLLLARRCKNATLI